MRGIISYGAYIPYPRLDRSKITEALGAGGGRGTRSVASFDEDTTTMAVEAGRIALRGASGVVPSTLLFSTTAPAYLDKNNATAVHAALDLPGGTSAYDMVGSARSAIGAMSSAVGGSGVTLVTIADMRSGLAGGSDESSLGDAACAFLLGDESDGTVIAEAIGGASATGEFLDRWRTPGDNYSKVWEERFTEAAFGPLVEDAMVRAYETAGLKPEDIDHVVLTGLAARAARSSAKFVGVAPDKYGDAFADTVGNTGAAAPGLGLCGVLDGAGAGEVLMVVNLADGVDVQLFRTTDAISSFAPASTVAAQIERGGDVSYAKYLSWRGMLTREPPRRPDPDRPSAPAAMRGDDWKFAFYGSECTECQARHLPPARVCVKCESVDQMKAVCLADVQATIASYTIDRLAFSESPPMVVAVADFDGGGRFPVEMADTDPESVKIGDRIEMSFRRIGTADGIVNYFWKAVPVV